MNFFTLSLMIDDDDDDDDAEGPAGTAPALDDPEGPDVGAPDVNEAWSTSILLTEAASRNHLTRELAILSAVREIEASDPLI